MVGTSLGCNVERPSWICYVNSVKPLILMSSLPSFSHLNSAYRVTAVLHHFNCATKYFIMESACVLPSSLLTMETVECGRTPGYRVLASCENICLRILKTQKVVVVLDGNDSNPTARMFLGFIS